MKQAIIVSTCKKFKCWRDNFIKTLNTDYPVIFVNNTEEKNMYDVLGVTTGIDLGIEEFLVLHDTTEIKDNAVFDIVFKDHKGKTVFLNPHGQMFLNKYVLKDMLTCGVDFNPLYQVKDKLGAVMAEGGFHSAIKQKCNPIVLFPEFIDGPKREIKFGRVNMVIENKYLKKYKGCWNQELIQDAKKYIPK